MYLRASEMSSMRRGLKLYKLNNLEEHMLLDTIRINIEFRFIEFNKLNVIELNILGSLRG